jgi:hypothetical protein
MAGASLLEGRTMQFDRNSSPQRARSDRSSGSLIDDQASETMARDPAPGRPIFRIIIAGAIAALLLLVRSLLTL